MGKKASSGNTPPRINLRGMYQLLSATEAPKIENRRLIGILMGTVAIIGAQALALAGLTPLKERIPYAVEVETATGAVAASGKPLAQWKPEEANLRYFLGRWTENLLAIDEHSRDMRLPGAYGMLRGDTAFRQFEKLVREDERAGLGVGQAVDLAVDVFQLGGELAAALDQGLEGGGSSHRAPFFLASLRTLSPVAAS